MELLDELGRFADLNKISYSEASTFARCEKQWAYRYLWDHESGPTRPMQLGTLMHNFLSRWWSSQIVENPTWLFDIENFDDPIEREVVDEAEWLAKRYLDHYGLEPTFHSIISVEQEFWLPARVFGMDFVIHGYIDRLVRDDEGRLWVVEDKTYGSRQRLDMINVDHQLTTYVMGAEHVMDEPVFGVLFNGIYTYQWKKPRAVEDSFDREYVDRTPTQRRMTLDWFAAINARRSELKTPVFDWNEPVANQGVQSCNGCGFKGVCWSSALGEDDVEIEFQ